MIKPANAPYRPGDRSTWAKVKRYRSTEAIVGGVTGTLAAPVELVLGRYDADSGQLLVVGRAVPLKPAQSAAIAPLLHAAGDGHLWPDVLTGGWGGGGKDTVYAKVDPRLVVEVRVDVATAGGRWRHGLRHLRPRPDLDPDTVPHNPRARRLHRLMAAALSKSLHSRPGEEGGRRPGHPCQESRKGHTGMGTTLEWAVWRSDRWS